MSKKPAVTVALILLAAFVLHEIHWTTKQLHWLVRNADTLFLLAAVVAAIVLVAGPAIAKKVRSGRKAVQQAIGQETPRELPTTSTGDIDWSAIVLNAELPSERKDV